jgi:hypothetical protein
MDLTEGSETSAKFNLTPGETPKENTQDSEHGETLKSRRQRYYFKNPLLHFRHGRRLKISHTLYSTDFTQTKISLL